MLYFRYFHYLTPQNNMKADVNSTYLLARANDHPVMGSEADLVTL